MRTCGHKGNWAAIATTATIILALAQHARAVTADGGDITVVDGYFVHTFTNSGTLDVTSDGDVEVLVVAGGGGGGATMGGGGGAGGLVYSSSYPVVVGNISVTVGNGGLGGYAYNATVPTQQGTRGGNSSFGDGIVVLGGGGGAGWSGHPSTSGGSGGGGNSAQAASAGMAGQGHAGNIGSATSTKRSGGGGGGAGATGGLGVAGVGGAGGDGIVVFGSYYGGGGGGGLDGAPVSSTGGGAGGLGGGGAGSKGTTKAIDATPNTGGGGGGAGYNANGSGRIGGNGGSGIVIVRYSLPSNLFVTVNAATTIGMTNASISATVYGVDEPDSAQVYLCWDTADRGTNSVGDWANVVDLGSGWSSRQTASTNLLTLQPEKTYFYRAYATHASGAAWSTIAREFTTYNVASGGSVTEQNGFFIHAFTNAGSTSFVLRQDLSDVEVLVVGGGGGGGETIGGGGGGGGVIYTSLVALAAGSYEVTVGAGGSGGWGAGYPAGIKGGDSTWGTLTAIGGGAGAGHNLAASGIGGSAGGNGAGGGARAGYTEDQGNDGGAHWTKNAGGGGGGAAEIGASGSSESGGKGGDGLGFEISGKMTYYGGGGGGGTRNATGPNPGAGGLGGGGTGGRSTAGNDGESNTGGGGGGGGYIGDLAGGKGGSGIVIVRYFFSSNLFVNAHVATSIGRTNASISATVYDGTGAPDGARVYLCWDTADRGTNSVGDWANVVDLGSGWSSRQTASTTLLTLQPAKMYFYRAYATNSRGEAWSTTVEFTTRYSWYVAPGASGSDGKSWATAFTNLQDALNVATHGMDDIFIAQGEYDVATELSWTTSGVRIMGGYEGIGTPGDCDPDQWETVLARTVSPTNRIFNISGVSDGLLRGVTVRDGFLRGTDYGAGLYIANSELTLDSCIIHTNQIQPTTINQFPAGAGVYSLGNTLLITNCLFLKNRTFGGTVNYNGSGHGAGLFVSGGQVTVVDSVFSRNTGAHIGNARSCGAAIYMTGGSHIIRRSQITDNTGNGHGGGLYLAGANVALVEECVIQGNYGTLSAGGVWMNGSTIRNSLVVSNSTPNNGGGIHMEGTSSRLENVTVAHNTSANALTIPGVNQTAGTIVNSLIYFNTRTYDDVQANITAAGGTITHSCTLPLREGEGNIASDPDFMDASNGDFSLRPGSPCEDAAVALDWMSGRTDLAGLPRIIGLGPDMGCYETGIPDVPLMVNFAADQIAGLDLLRVTFTTAVTGTATNGLTYSWDFDNDGSFDEQGSDKETVQHDYGPGLHSVRLRVTNDASDEDEVIRSDYIFVSAAEIYVSLTGSGENGLSWATAFTNLQTALDFANGSNTIYLAGQTFAIDAQLLLGDRQEIKLLGGYEANPATVGPGPYHGTTVIQRNAAAGSFRILDVAFVEGLLLERLTITRGNTPTSGVKATGGGVNILGSVADLVDCVFSNNQANSSGNGKVWGGGVYAGDSTLNIRRTLFTKNTAKGTPYHNNNRAYGGGVAAENSAVTLLDCQFMENAADAQGHHGSWGGAICITGGSGLVSNVVMNANKAGPNRALAQGGGIYFTAGTRVVDCVIVANRIWNARVGDGGGGVYMSGGLLRNSLVADNEGIWDGGGLYATGGQIENVTVAGNANSETQKVAGVFLSGSVTMTNSIVFGNRGEDEVQNIGGNTAQVGYSCAPELTSGVNGNMTADPMFAAPHTGNYRLMSCSPCRNAGDNLDWMIDAVDLAGNPRLKHGRVDMGAYEIQPPAGTIFILGGGCRLGAHP